jgi:hypothetical protein
MMSKVTKEFGSSRIRKAEYDPATQQLDLHWDNRSILSYRHVPQEVFRRLCSAPNPPAYWEDRIADEYPKGPPKAPPAGGSAAGQPPPDLFGGDD